MSALRSAAVAAALSVASISAATNALAVPNRTAVSVAGTDSGNCAPAAPCRSIAYALTQTTPGGQMLVLNSGGYGPFTITQSVSIIAPTGVVAAVSAGSGDGITINAGASDTVLLEGFFIDGLGTGMNGITVKSAQTVSVIGSKITAFVAEGIMYSPAASAGTTKLALSNTSIYGNGVGSLYVSPSGGMAGYVTASIVAEGSTFARSPVTFDTSNSVGGVQAVLDNCIIRNIPATLSGIVANAPTGVATNVQFLRSTMVTVGTGFSAIGSGAHIAVGSSGLSDVGTVALAASGGQVGSYGNNNMAFFNALGPLANISQH